MFTEAGSKLVMVNIKMCKAQTSPSTSTLVKLINEEKIITIQSNRYKNRRREADV